MHPSKDVGDASGRSKGEVLLYGVWTSLLCVMFVPLLFQYIRLLHLYHRSGPILLHCSAGIGRTGSLIAIDATLAHIEHNLKVRCHLCFNIGCTTTVISLHTKGILHKYLL